MKKNILVTAFFYVFALQAQVRQNDIIFGGSGNVSFAFKNDESDASTINATILPNLGYMFKEKWSVQTGVGIIYSYNNFINLQNDKRYISHKMFIQSQISFRRFWFMNNKCAFYLEPKWINYIKVRDKQNIDGERQNLLKYQKQFSLQWGLEPGFIFFPIENLSLEFNVGGLAYNLDIEKWEKNTKIKHSINTLVQPIGVSIGVKKYFKRKAKE